MTAPSSWPRAGVGSFRPFVRAALGAAALLLLAACGGGTGPGWTVAPITVAPSSAAAAPGASGSPAAGSPGASTVPAATGSTAPASAAPGSAAPSSPAPASPAANAPPAGGSPTAPSDSPAPSQASGTTIELEETEDLNLLQNGQPVTQLNVKVGDTIVFTIDNSADFDHNFYIGPADKLANDDTAGLPGLPNFQGTQELTYTVTADTANLQFGCPLEGHYPTMHGTFVVTP